MKYLVVLADGMADYPIEALGNRTPMEVARKPMMDMLSKHAYVGTVSNVPTGMVPESDTANLAVLSYDPRVYSKGRSPLEAMSMGLTMTPDETAIRCNVVTLSEDEDTYEDKVILDHSADEITTEEADVLIRALEDALGTEDRHFYTGISYRHCLIWKNIPSEYSFDRPHDHLGEQITQYLPRGEAGAPYLALMKKSYEILNHHPINEERRRRGLKPANSIWLWSPGKKPQLPSFEKKWGLRGAVISAVDLIKGIGICADMTSIDVPGATGNVHTNYSGKADAAIGAFRDGYDFVYIHVEAPDECGHRAELANKIRSIELIDEKILTPVYNYLSEQDEDFAVMVLPDHPTPIVRRTHTMDPVPFFIWKKANPVCGVDSFTEKTAAEKQQYLSDGCELLSHMI